jgi:hypothetical protein
MQFTVPRLKTGQQVEAIVSECFPDGDVLVDFHGDLVRVKNRTGLRLEVGDFIRLRVLTVRPLSFQFVARPKEFRRRIDVSV